MPEPLGESNIPKSVSSEGMLSPVGKSIWGLVALLLGNGLLPMIERNHEVERK
jgi:hypothetical protein